MLYPKALETQTFKLVAITQRAHRNIDDDVKTSRQ
jgi:hypothetical protein